MSDEIAAQRMTAIFAIRLLSALKEGQLKEQRLQ
jgi:hypothetical protein